MTDWRLRLPWTAAVVGLLWPDGPARRKRWLTMAILVLVAIAAHAGLTVIQSARTARAERAFVARWGPPDMATHRPAAVENGANAARAVLAAAKLLVLPASPVSAAARLHERFASDARRDFTHAEREVIRDAVRDNATALSILDVAAARPGSDWELHYEWGIEVDVPPLLDILKLATLNAAAGRLAVEDGRFDDALAAVRRGRALARSLEDEPVVMVQLVRLAVTRLDARLTRLVLGRLDLSPGQLGALAALRADERPRQRMQESMIAETKAIGGAFRSRAGSARVARPASHEEGLLGLGIVRAAARPYLLAEERVWLDLMNRRLAPMDVPRHARGAADAAPRLRAWNVLVRIAESNWESVLDLADLAEARVGLARTALAIERHRVARGHPPRTLTELVPDFLDGVPLDPLTGQPFAYASDGSGWTLRSTVDPASIRNGGPDDPVLEWSRPLTLPAR